MKYLSTCGASSLALMLACVGTLPVAAARPAGSGGTSAAVLPAASRSGGSVAGAPTLELESCRPPGVSGESRCGTLRVFEDRAAARGRTIDLNILVLAARDDDPRPDPIFFLHGGPGGAATALAPLFANSPLRRTRDIVLVDQRGTGRSGALNCPGDPIGESLRAMASFDIDVERCLAGLDADPRLYVTSIAMDDLDDVRRALGYDRINLFGASYGTRAALEYMRRHPDRARTAVLRGVASTAFDLPLHFGRSSQAALDDVLADCTADRSCRKAFPRGQKKLREVIARLEREPALATFDDPTSGDETTLSVDRQLFALALHYALYNSGTAARIPRFIQSAYDGDFDALIGSTARFAAALAPQLSDGLFLSVVCAEDTPYFTIEQAERLGRGTLLGGSLAGNLKRTCERWPAGEIPAGYRDPVRSDVPTLLISGDADPVTPPDHAAEVARHLSRGVHVVLDGTGHASLTPGCTGRLVQELLDSGDVAGLKAECVKETGRPAFDTSR